MSWLKNLKIAKKLLLINISSLIFIVLVGVVGINYMNQMAQQSKTMYEDQLLPVKWINELRAHTRATQALLLQLVVEKNPQNRENLKQELATRSENFGKAYESYKKTHLPLMSKNSFQK